MVAGPDAEATARRIHDTPGPRWFGADRPIRHVHADSAMFVGGLNALLMQSLHPLAMAAVAQHSDYRVRPWGRLQRTAAFIGMTTYAAERDAQRAVDAVRRVHKRVHGVTDSGRPYRADDPHLLGWVHAVEVDSFLRCHQRYGAAPLDSAGCDGYVLDMARIGSALGVVDPPTDVASLEARLAAYRPELSGTPEARAAARFLLIQPPLPLLARAPYAVLAATAVAMLPAWARWPLRLPYLPVSEATTIRLAGHGLIGALRWVTTG